jgi:hypothetical protein
VLGEEGRWTHQKVDQSEEAADLRLVAAGRMGVLRIWKDLMWGAVGKTVGRSGSGGFGSCILPMYLSLIMAAIISIMCWFT